MMKIPTHLRQLNAIRLLAVLVGLAAATLTGWSQTPDLFTPPTDSHVSIPGTAFYIIPPVETTGFRQLDPVGRVYGTAEGESIVVFETKQGKDQGSMVWELLGLLKEKEIREERKEEIHSGEVDGVFRVCVSGMEGSEMVAWTLELTSGEDVSAVVGICPSELRDSVEDVFAGIFGSIRMRTMDSSNVFAGWPVSVDMAQFGYELTSPMMPGSLTFAPADIPEGEFPEQVFIFGRPEPEEIEHFNEVRDTVATSGTRLVERGASWVKVVDWSRDQRGAVDRLEFTVYLVCGDVHIGGFGMGRYSEDLLSHFREIAAQIQCK